MQSTSFPFSEPEPISDHRCIGKGCEYCKPRRRSSVISHPDPTGTAPNHNCWGQGCPLCSSKRRTSTLHARSTLQLKCRTKRRAMSIGMQKCALQSLSSNGGITPLFSDSSEFLNMDISVTGSSHFEGEPPHQCRDLPCEICGKGKKF